LLGQHETRPKRLYMLNTEVFYSY